VEQEKAMTEIDPKAAYHRTFNGSLAKFPQNLVETPSKKVRDAFREYGARTAYTFRDKKLAPIMYLEKKDQEFKKYATGWEIHHSKIPFGDGSGIADPVVDGNMTVVGHYGTFDSSCIFVPKNISEMGSKTVEEPVKQIFAPGWRAVEKVQKSLGLSDYVAAGADVIADNYHEDTYFKQGYRRFHRPQASFTVITDIEGHVLLVLGSRDKDGIKSHFMSPLDLVMIGKLVLLGVTAVVGALTVRTLVRRMAARRLAHSTAARELTGEVTVLTEAELQAVRGGSPLSEEAAGYARQLVDAVRQSPYAGDLRWRLRNNGDQISRDVLEEALNLAQRLVEEGRGLGNGQAAYDWLLLRFRELVTARERRRAH
jgi:hypothetical protein